MPKTRVAIAGLGRAAKAIHIPALRKLRDVEIVGGYDPVQQKGDFPIFASLGDLLAMKPDVVVIATPPDSHRDIAVAALEAGVHVFCEKPLASSIEEADAVAVAAAAAGRKVCINSEFPFMPTHLAAAREIGSERFGRLLFAELHQTFVVTDETESGWRGNDLQRTFKEFGTHVIDLCKAFFGEQPKAMHARMPRPFASGGPDYLNLVQLDFSGDRVAQITLDRLTKGRHRYLDIRLVGEKGTIETSIGGSAEVTMGLRPTGRKPFADLNLHMGGAVKLYHGDRSTTLAKAPLDLFADATARLFREFLDAIREGREPPSGIDEARNTLELIYRAYAEAEAHRS
jgi:predicted dehydrogenase